MSYFIRVGDAASQLVNVALLFGDNANESISGRAYRQRKECPYWMLTYRAINGLFFWQGNHCQEAFINDLVRAHALIKSNPEWPDQ